MTKRRFMAKERYQILEEARQPGTSVAEICRRYQISTGLYYSWEKAAKQGVLEALNGKRRQNRESREIEKLQEKITSLRTVISEITEENLSLKKTLGG